MSTITTQSEFDEYFITSTEIVQEVGVARSTIKYAREQGILPGAIEINNGTIFLWPRGLIRPYIDAWKSKRHSEQHGENKCQ